MALTMLIFVFQSTRTACAQNLDIIGVTLLQSVMTNLNGAGIRVAQPEANTDGNTNNPSAFEVSPGAVNLPAIRFAYISAAGTTNIFPNSVGNESGHADGVAQNFYGMSAGVATNVVHVDNYDADYFYNSVIAAIIPPNINDRVINQSFIFGSVPDQVTIAQQQQIDQTYDNYAAQYNTLFVSGAGNGGSVCPPATCYNGIGVGVSDGSSSYGPTIDNGRCKPDIIAPGGATSFSTPFVSGAAAVLMQAALRGDGGSDTNSAFAIQTIKALLLNGAVKPADWANTTSSPLDNRYGAGVLNVFNSYEQLAGGKRGYVVSTTVTPAGGAHPPTGATGSIAVLNGWDFNTNTSSSTADTVNHYYFNVTNGMNGATFMATATLAWNRHRTKSSINNLDLFLYDAANSNLVACSTSLVDNVEHVFVPKLAPGRYDLQVWKAAGIPSGTIVSSAEPYALAFAFTAPAITVTGVETNVVLSWPLYPAGFCVEATPDLATPVWSTNGFPSASFTNNMNSLLLNASDPVRFFRLRQPNF